MSSIESTKGQGSSSRQGATAEGGRARHGELRARADDLYATLVREGYRTQDVVSFSARLVELVTDSLKA